MMKSTTLQDKLAQSLDRANTAETKSRPRQKAIAPLPPEKRCTKISVSRFGEDMKRVAALRAYILGARGVSISTSQVIKIALRTAPQSLELCKALDAAAAEDGRKW